MLNNAPELVVMVHEGRLGASGEMIYVSLKTTTQVQVAHVLCNIAPPLLVPCVLRVRIAPDAPALCSRIRPCIAPALPALSGSTPLLANLSRHVAAEREGLEVGICQRTLRASQARVQAAVL